MGIAKTVATVNNNHKFVIPDADDLFYYKGKLVARLCKGYIETSDLFTMLAIRGELADLSKKIKNVNRFQFVGDVDKLRYANTVIYRQRVYFLDLEDMLQKIKILGLRLTVGENFSFNMANITLCNDALPYLQIYASRQNENIETYLNNTCILQLCNMLERLNMYNTLTQQMNELMSTKNNYLYRAPYLMAKYKDKNNILLVDDRPDGYIRNLVMKENPGITKINADLYKFK